MGKRGRPRKPGRRLECGRLKKDNHAALFDKGSDWVQSRKALFGEHYGSAIGRAFAWGLLGEGQQAKDRYEAGKRLYAVRKRYYGHKGVRCPLDDTPRGGNVVLLNPELQERDEADKAYLADCERKIDPGCAPYLDQLLDDLFTDQGPYWIQNLIEGPTDNRDRMVLQAALRALDAICPRQVEPRIRVA
jgi:hypothetical protein